MQISRNSLVISGNFDLQGDRVQNSKWWHLKANIKIYKSLHSPIAHTLFEKLTFKMCDLENVGQGQIVQLVQCVIRWKISKSIKVVVHIFELSSRRFREIHISNLTSKSKGTVYNFLTGVIRWQISKSIQVAVYIFR